MTLKPKPLSKVAGAGSFYLPRRPHWFAVPCQYYWLALALARCQQVFFSTLPFLVTIAQYKELIFALSAMILVLAAWAVFRANRACPADPGLAAQCERAHRFNKYALFASLCFWFIGFTAAYLALPIYNWLN